jgi:ATP-dependent Clp protease ATP-binding subunit ClpC
MLTTVSKQLSEKSIILEVTDAARDFLGEKGYDEIYGARPLRRVIQDKVEDRLSEELLRGKFKSGETVVVDVEDNEIVLRTRQAVAVAGGNALTTDVES